MTTSGGGINNDELKKKNAKVFSTICSRLESDDEKTYVDAADKISKFIGRKEAYYPEARQLIADSFKSARLTLTRLSGNEAPFRRDTAYPQTLERRVQAYVKLIETGSRFRGELVTTDIHTSDIWSSINKATQSQLESAGQNAPPSKKPGASAVASKDIPEKNAQDSSEYTVSAEARSSASVSLANLQERPKSVAQDKPSQTSAGKNCLEQPGSRENPRAMPVETTPQAELRPLPRERDGSESTLVGTERMEDNVSTTQGYISTTNESQISPGPSAIQTQLTAPTRVASPLTSIRNSLAKRKSSSPSPLSLSRPATPQSAPFSPLSTNMPGPSSSIGPSAMSPSTEKAPKPAPATAPKAKPRKKPKLGGKTNSVLLGAVKEVDVEWWKQKSGPALPAVSGAASSSSVLLENKSPVIPQDPVQFHALSGQKHSEATVQSPNLTDKQAAVSRGPDAMDVDRAPTGSAEALSDETSASSSKDVTMNDVVKSTPPPQSKPSQIEQPLMSHVVAAGPEALVATEELAMNGNTAQANDHGPKNVNVCLALAGTTGSSVRLRLELDLRRQNLLQRWCARDEHEQDMSDSLCVSLACYKMDDIVDAGVVPSDLDSNLDSSLLTKLKSSWPSNARLGAEIGTSTVFLSPPLEPTAENLVDISSYVGDDMRAEVTIIHACDMSEYIIALIAHVPTASQLSYLEERRAKASAWRAALEELGKPFTFAEIFPPKTVEA